MSLLKFKVVVYIEYVAKRFNVRNDKESTLALFSCPYVK